MLKLFCFILFFLSNVHSIVYASNTCHDDNKLVGMGSAVKDSINDKILEPRQQRLTIATCSGSNNLKDMNPLYIASTGPTIFFKNVFEGIISPEIEGNKEMGSLRPKCGSAESYYYDENTLTWTINIKKNLKWSDGSKLTAHDFVRFLRSKLDPNSYPNNIIPTMAKSAFSKQPILKNTEKILNNELPIEELGAWAEGDYCLKLQYENKHVLNSSFYNLIELYPLHKDYINEIYTHENDKDFSKICVNGPFMVADFKDGSYILLKKNPHYWDERNVILREIKILYLAEDNIIPAWQAGVIDLAAIDEEDLEKLRGGDIPYVAPYPESSFKTFFINCENPKLNHACARRALNVLLNRDILIRSLRLPPKEKLYGFLDKHDENVSIVTPYWVELDLESQKREAISLLRSAGYNEKNKLRLDFFVQSDGPLSTCAAALLNQIPSHLSVNLVKRESKAFFGELRNGNYDILMCGSVVNSPEFYEKFYKQLYSNNNILNKCRFKHDRFNEILRNMTKLDDSESLRELERILQHESPMIPLFLCNIYYLVSPAVGNWPQTSDHCPSDGNLYFKRLFRKAY